jgi:hypothetical protein
MKVTSDWKVKKKRKEKKTLPWNLHYNNDSRLNDETSQTLPEECTWHDVKMQSRS